MEDVAYILLTLTLRLTQSPHSAINPNAMGENNEIVHSSAGESPSPSTAGSTKSYHRLSIYIYLYV